MAGLSAISCISKNISPYELYYYYLSHFKIHSYLYWEGTNQAIT